MSESTNIIKNQRHIVLYHTLGNEECAIVRKAVVQMNLVDLIQFRNIERSEAAQKDLMQSQGSLEVPFLVVDGKGLSGLNLILKILSELEIK